MKIVTAHLKSASPYSQSKHYVRDDQPNESKDDAYRRTWRNHMHTDDDGIVYIPPMAFKNSLSEAAKFLSIKIPGGAGGGKATYTKHFEAGILVLKPLSLRIHRDNAEHEALFLPADGRRGSGSRIMKYYPIFRQWAGDVEFTILDETVLHTCPDDKAMTVFEKALRATGNFIGIGRFRPKQNGFYGRFTVEAVTGV